MDLVATVSEITGRQVSIQEAKNFAMEQFGVLSSYLLSKNKPTVKMFEDSEADEPFDEVSLAKFEEMFNNGDESLDMNWTLIEITNK